MIGVIWIFGVFFAIRVESVVILDNEGIPQLATCTTGPYTSPCFTFNNCSRRLLTDPCMLIVSLPPEPENTLPNENDPENRADFSKKASPVETWTMGLLSVGIISLSGVTGAVLWPIMSSPYYPKVMSALLGLAVGSLSSTALFQLIPEAFQIAGQDPTFDYLKTACYAWFSIWVIYFIEGSTKIAFRKTPQKTKEETKTDNRQDTYEKVPLKEDQAYLEKPQQDDVEKNNTKPISAVAWMVIFGDSLHNFIDGMTIGAGYSQNIGTGIGLSMAIACEEFPHELGDFAILLQAGIPLTKALLYNFLSACTAFLGLIFGIALGQLEGAHYIFAFAGSLFLYITLGHLIPELKGEIKKGLKENRFQGALIFTLQNIGIFVGSCLIYTITRHNDYLTHLFS